ncbi:MAG: SDR family oxidoreductase [Planctomycetaceae bacterium]|nr:SDR family oxidoreductase [Planctomycetaceae bacterium]
MLQPGRDLALITGASSGIGVQIARQLAARGIDLILTARRRERLEALAAELTDRSEGQISRSEMPTVVVIDADLAASDGPDRLLAELAARNLAPTVLINNAGFGYFDLFLEQSRDEIEAMIAVNLRAATILARELGAQMASRRRGYILSVASFAAIAPIPRYAVYSGAKAYLIAWTQALAHELRKSGVSVSVICPGFTRTEFHDVARHKKTRLMQLIELTPEQVARAAIRGMERGQLVIVPGWWYKLNAALTRLLPRSWASAMSAKAVK